MINSKPHRRRLCAFRLAEGSTLHSLPMCNRRGDAFDQPTELCKRYSHSCQAPKGLMYIVLFELSRPMARHVLFNNLLLLIMRCAMVLVLEFHVDTLTLCNEMGGLNAPCKRGWERFGNVVVRARDAYSGIQQHRADRESVLMRSNAVHPWSFISIHQRCAMVT